MEKKRYLVLWMSSDGAILGRREIRAQTDASALQRGMRIMRQEQASGFWCWALSEDFREVHDALRVGS